MTFKEKLRERIEKDSVVSELDGELVILKKGSALSWIPVIGNKFKDWGRIYPALDENENILWLNTIFGGWRNFVILLIVLGIICMFFFGVYNIFHGLTNRIDIVCDYYTKVNQPTNETIRIICNLPTQSSEQLIGGLNAAG